MEYEGSVPREAASDRVRDGAAPGVAPGLSTIPYYTPAAVSRFLTSHAERHGDYPVTAVEIYRRDAVVKKRGGVPKTRDGDEVAKRGRVTEFTDKSMMRSVFVAKNCDADFNSIITLTYPGAYESDGRRVKRHLEAFREDYLDRYQGARGMWWLEFQKRGAPHFHILSTVDLSEYGGLVKKRRTGRRDGAEYWTCLNEERWLALRWFDIVGSDDERHKAAGVSWEMAESHDGAIRYMCSHGAKRAQKKVPPNYTDVGRFWGKIGAIKVERVGVCRADGDAVFNGVGHSALSTRGKIKKYLFDAAGRFSADEI